MIEIKVCPGNLTPGFDNYSPACLRQLFDGKKVSPILDFNYDADKDNFQLLSIKFRYQVYKRSYQP